jgi:glycosyltransferase involved in cell wall biosynthesis
MRIVLDARCATTHFPGIGRYIVNLARGLQSIAPDLDLILLVDSSARGRIPLPALPQIECNVSPFSLSQQWRVPLALRRAGATLYHSPYYLMPYAPGVPSVFTCYDFIPLLFPAYFSAAQRFVYRLAHWLALRATRGVITISETTRADLARFFDVKQRRVVVTPLAPDSRFAPSTHSVIEAMRQKYNLPGDYVLYLGSNKPHKNLPLLVRAFAQSSIAHQTTLVIAGQWDVRYPDARNIAAETSARILFLDAVADADLPALYGGATLFVFPSQYEGFGLPPLEAMACGAPVACSNIPSLRDVVDDAGAFFDLNVNAVQTTLEHLLNDPSLRERLRERGLARAAQFSWEQTARATLQIYRTIIGEG